MKKLLAGLNRLLHPPGWALLLMLPAAAAALVWLFRTGRNSGALAYAVYVLSAYCLTAAVLPLPKLLRRARAAVMRRIDGTALGSRYVHDLAFRGRVGICQGVAVDFFYAAFRFAAGLRYASVWFLSMAAYYLGLGALRLSLLVSGRRGDRESELRCYRRTARLLFLLNLPMGGMILLMVLTDSGYSYPGYIIYLSAAYTFYTAAMSVVNLVRFRRLGSPVLSAAKVLNFIAALMSVLGLQTAMIAEFSTEGDGFRRLMNAVTGGAVWSAVILTAACMLYRSGEKKDEVSPAEQSRE